MEKFKEMKKEGWENETSQRGGSLKSFLQQYSERNPDSKERYDNLTELHFSGTNVETIEKIKKGTGKLSGVNVFYKDGEIAQVHAVFDGEGHRHNIDVYLKGKALEDYLNQ